MNTIDIKNKYITNIGIPDIINKLNGQPNLPRFERFHTIPVKPELNLQVPHIIHFIWIGSLLPYIYVKNILSFVATNKDRFIYKLWVDYKTPHIDGVEIYDIRTDFPIDKFINKDIYDIENNWGSKADILRYEIVYQEGGIYSDIDAISLKPFDENFNKSFVTYTGEPYNDLACGFFGFPPGSRYLKYLIDCIREVRTYSFDYSKLETKIRVPLLTGPIIFTQCFQFYNDPNIQMISQDITILNKDNPDAYSYHTFDSMWWDKK